MIMRTSWKTSSTAKRKPSSPHETDQPIWLSHFFAVAPPTALSAAFRGVVEGTPGRLCPGASFGSRCRRAHDQITQKAEVKRP